MKWQTTKQPCNNCGHVQVSVHSVLCEYLECSICHHMNPAPYVEESEKAMSNEQIETMRVAGDITLVLKNGTEEEKQSLLRAVEKLCGIEERLRLEQWVRDGMPGA